MIRRALFCAALCCAVIVPAAAQPTPVPRQHPDPIIGVWQASNPASNSKYTFYPHGKLNQGETWKRAASGGYALTLAKGDKATATVTQQGHHLQVVYLDRGTKTTFTKISSKPQ